MGMYVCGKHFEQYKLTEGMGATNHGQCEICGNVDNDWQTHFDLRFITDIDRPVLVKDNREFVLTQIAVIEERNRREQVLGRNLNDAEMNEIQIDLTPFYA